MDYIEIADNACGITLFEAKRYFNSDERPRTRIQQLILYLNSIVYKDLYKYGNLKNFTLENIFGGEAPVKRWNGIKQQLKSFE